MIGRVWMWCRRALAGAAVAGALAVSMPAGAVEYYGELPPGTVPYPSGWGQPFINEFRVGGYYHGIGNPERNTGDVNVEVLTQKIWTPPDPDFWWLAPRFHAGGNINTAGRTNYGYFGLTWTWDNLWWKNWFLEYSFGPSFNDGYTGLTAPFDRAKLGCSVLFRESGSLGYRFDEHWSIMATVDHVSNGGLCKENRGITNAGVRLGYTW